MQPPARGAAQRPDAGTVFIEDIDGEHGPAALPLAAAERAIVGEAQIVAQPDDDGTGRAAHERASSIAQRTALAYRPSCAGRGGEIHGQGDGRALALLDDGNGAWREPSAGRGRRRARARPRPLP